MSDVDKAVPVCSFVILCSDHVDSHDFSCTRCVNLWASIAPCLLNTAIAFRLRY